MGRAFLILALAGCTHRGAPDAVRMSRPAAGTVVGITARDATPAQVEAGFAAIEAGEAALSEWRPTSKAAALARGEPVTLSPAEREVFAAAEAARTASEGAFDVCWKGGRLRVDAGVRAEGCPGLDLGALLKGWLADQAASTLFAAGVTHFVVDVGGDVVAHGDAGDGLPGWPVAVAVAGHVVPLRLHDRAVSTASDEQQPGHIKDARTGRPAAPLVGVWAVASSGLLADTWDTATMAAGQRLVYPPGVCTGLVSRAEGVGPPAGNNLVASPGVRERCAR